MLKRDRERVCGWGGVCVCVCVCVCVLSVWDMAVNGVCVYSCVHKALSLYMWERFPEYQNMKREKEEN